MTARPPASEQGQQLAEVLAQQRATSEILRLISRTHDSAQPVFDTIAEAALRLCGATAANVFTFDRLRLMAPEVAYDLPAGGRRLVQRAEGYRATVVSGVVAYRDGEPTGSLPGRLVRGPQNERRRWSSRIAA